MKSAVFSVLVPAVLLSSLAASAHASSQYLGSDANFAVLGGSTVTNTGSTTLEGDLGLSPGTSITDESGITVNGTLAPNSSVFINNSTAQQAQSDLTTAISNLEALGPGTVLSGSSYQTTNGQTLLPGIYSTGTTLEVTGTLDLNFNSEPDASFVFLVGTALNVDGSSTVVLENVASGDSLFWVMSDTSGTDATIGTFAAFQGNILAASAITVDTGATIYCGRALASTSAAVTMDTNFISITCENAPVTNTSNSSIAAGNAFLEASNGLAGAASTPEPGTFLLLGTGLLAIGISVRRKIIPR